MFRFISVKVQNSHMEFLKHEINKIKSYQIKMQRSCAMVTICYKLQLNEYFLPKCTQDDRSPVNT